MANSNGLSTLVIQLTMLASVFMIIPLVAMGTMKNVELAMLALFVLASFETVLTLPTAFIELPLTLSAAKRLFDLEDKHITAEKPNNLDVQLANQLAINQDLVLS